MAEQTTYLRKKLSTPAKAVKTGFVELIKSSFDRHLESSLAKDNYSAINLDYYKSLAYAVRDRLIKKWLKSQQAYYKKDVKRIYYLSMEFLIGRMLGNALINLDLYEEAYQALQELGHNLEDLQEMEIEAGLGNGGLGRLAACFLDSMATLELPAYGYGIRYDYGIFYQKIADGYQVETSDNWCRFGYPWEIERPEHLYPVNFYGRVKNPDNDKIEKRDWVDMQTIMALAYDIPVPGYNNNSVINMRLWSAKSTRELNFEYFRNGDYEKAVAEKVDTETISKLLYPPDNIPKGKELRLKQEYFFVSATLQDIIRRFRKNYNGNPEFEEFPDKVAIQLNDTHPSIAIAELMRLLIDTEGIKWEKAWEITVKTFGYTNHTILPEAMEKWPVHLIEYLLPRHLQIIYEINDRFLKNVRERYPDDSDRQRRMSIIEEGEKKVRMAHLSIVGSHSVNGVSKLHTKILKEKVFKDFYDIWPDRFNNKTNGITQRRWLKLCNPELSQFISENIGDGWVANLFELKNLIPFANERAFQVKWREIKQKNKKRLAEYVKSANGIDLNIDSIFDCQVKRIHEYKRQLLNALHVINLYNQIKASPKGDFVPRTVIFAGKAAPSYYMAKLIIKLLNSIADIVNNDKDIKDKLKVVFLANYSVSLAELIIPAIELSEQISTAGTEASGTGNMKAALNGALTIGTLDGANIEIKEAVGDENIFIFGLTGDEIAHLKQSGYNPMDYYQKNPELKLAIDMIGNGYFSKSQPDLFKPIVNSLLNDGDCYFVMADFEPLVKCQKRVRKTYKNWNEWTKMSILNTANMGGFSSDKTIIEYAEEIWNVKPVSTARE